MHHSHAALTVTSLPSASYLTWGSVLETSRLRLCGQTEDPLAGICGTRGRLGETRWRSVVGRHLYDMTNAGAVRHPMDVTTVVLTQRRRASSRPRELRLRHRRHRGGGGKGEGACRGKDVVVNGGRMARQPEAGLLDAVGVELVPVVLGGDAAVRRARRHAGAVRGTRRGGRGRRRHAPALPGTE